MPPKNFQREKKVPEKFSRPVWKIRLAAILTSPIQDFRREWGVPCVSFRSFAGNRSGRSGQKWFRARKFSAPNIFGQDVGLPKQLLLEIPRASGRKTISDKASLWISLSENPGNLWIHLLAASSALCLISFISLANVSYRRRLAKTRCPNCISIYGL
jgi:hypothetical protein